MLEILNASGRTLLSFALEYLSFSIFLIVARKLYYLLSILRTVIHKEG